MILNKSYMLIYVVHIMITITEVFNFTAIVEGLFITVIMLDVYLTKGTDYKDTDGTVNMM